MGKYRFKGLASPHLLEELRVLAADAAVIEMGDMIQWDTSTKSAKQCTAAAADKFRGVCESEPIVSRLGETLDRIKIRSQGVHDFKTTGGDTYFEGDAVYMGADPQTVTKTAGTSFLVGYVSLPPEEQAAGRAGGAGIEVPVNIYPKYPTTGIH